MSELGRWTWRKRLVWRIRRWILGHDPRLLPGEYFINKRGWTSHGHFFEEGP